MSKIKEHCGSKSYIRGNITVECNLEKNHKGAHKGEYLRENWEGLLIIKSVLKWDKNGLILRKPSKEELNQRKRMDDRLKGIKL